LERRVRRPPAGYNLDSSDPETIALDTGDVAYESFTRARSTATPTGLRYDHDNLYLDLQGKSFTAGQKIVFDLTFHANGDWLT
jgi:hypothetical protein